MTIFDLLEGGNVDSIRNYIGDGGKVDGLDRFGRSPLYVAALAGNKAVCDLLKESGAEPDFFTEVALGSAVRSERYLGKGFSANSVNAQGMQPLMVAASLGHVDVARMLLENGAVVNARHAISGKTALMFAAEAGRAELVRFLLDRGADPRARNLAGKDAAQVAAEAGHSDVAELISFHRRG